MARNIRAGALENRTARLKLARRPKPYWVRIARGLSLGYRRIVTAGPWIVRRATGDGGNWIKNFATADDFEESNGDDVLTFWEAQAIARTIARGGETDGGLTTVAIALDRYAADLRARGARLSNARLARTGLSSALLAKPMGLLTVRDLRQHRDGLLRGRTAGSVNRIAGVLQAALELAASQDARITNQSSWKLGLRKLPDAARSRNVVLADADIRSIIGLAYEESPEFGRLVEAAAASGARPSQLGRLEIADLQADRPDPRLMMPTSAKGRIKRVNRRPVPVSHGLARSLQQAAADRPPTARLLVKPDGDPWGATNHNAPFARVVERAGLDPAVVTIYALRHSSITRQLLANVPVRLVAHAHDTSVEQIEKTYSASISEHGEALFRRALFDFDAPAAAENIIALTRKG